MKRRLFRAVLVLMVVAAVVVVATPLGRYLSRAAFEEARILLRRQRIAELVADSATSPALRERLRLVLAAREFAVDSLGLDAGDSFLTYSRVDRDTLVLVLSAAFRDRLEPYRWWFPVVGRLPYKGYFSAEAALQDRARFQALGFDTYMRPASAFSTLGWFNDPLLSTTVRAESTWLANTVIHELSHNTLFVSGNAEFSESFASFIGARGAERFFRARGSRLAAEQVAADWEADKVLGMFWEQTASALDSAYGEWPGDSAARVAARDSVYARARRALVDSVGRLLPGVPTQRWERIQLDNAALLARRVYAGHLDLFDSVYEQRGRDVRAAMEAILAAVRGSDDAFEALRRLRDRAPG